MVQTVDVVEKQNSLINIALLQTNPKIDNPAYNRRRAEMLIENAMQKKPKPDLIILPETWVAPFDMTIDPLLQAQKHAESADGPSLNMLQNCAKRFQVWICAGSITLQSLEESDEKYSNTSFLINRKGEILSVYDKVHLCSWVGEDIPFRHGERVSVIDTELCRMGIQICYDIRFPELARKQALDGVKLLLIPSYFTTSLEHWRILLQARAIENQLFVAACNCCGFGGGVRRFGHSMVIDPQGRIIAEAEDEEMILFASIDLLHVEKTRKTVTYLMDRQPLDE
jgi:predicted amidohydrolase